MLRSLGARTFVLPAPVFLVGVYDRNGRANIMPASSGGLCASQPPSLAVSVRKTRWTHAAVLERGAFTVSLPSCALAARVDYAGLHSGAEVDKFAALGLTPVAAEHVDAPYVAECPAVVELSLLHSTALGSHTLFIGEIMDVKVDTACLRDDGLPDPDVLDPLVFVPLLKEYRSLGGFVSRAYSTGHTVGAAVVLEQTPLIPGDLKAPRR